MKREQLTALGLDKEIIEKVFALYGQSINEMKQANETATSDLQAKLDEANTTITKASESTQSVEQVQKELDDYKAKYEQANATLETERKALAIKEALSAEGGTDLEYLTYKLGEIEDVSKVAELVTKLKTDLPGHFGKQVEPDTTIKLDGYEVLGAGKLPKVEPDKTYSLDDISKLSADEINANWSAISATQK